MMRFIDLVVVHCSATKEGKDFDVEDVRRWHKERGFTDVGYHAVIKLDGRVQNGRPLGEAGAHARGFNSRSLGICYIGGVGADGKAKDTRTDAQREALERTLREWRRWHPKARIRGHRDLGAPKDCPSFDVASWCRSIGLDPL